MAVRELDLPPNTDRSKADNEKRLKERMVTQNRPVKREVAKKKDKGMLETLVSEFIVEDVGSVFDNVIQDTVKPWIKTGIYNTIDDTVRQLLGEPGRSGRGVGRNTLTDYRGRSNAERTYNNGTNVNRNDRSGNSSTSGRFNSRDYAFKTRGQAEEALETLRGDIESFDRATVATFLKCAGVTPDWHDNDIGWTDLSSDVCYIRGSLDGYVLVLPPPKSVKY